MEGEAGYMTIRALLDVAYDSLGPDLGVLYDS